MQPLLSEQVKIDYHSKISDLLRELPPPSEPIIVAIYKFRDQTGQYKPSETTMQYSTAVTQGATSMLIRALVEAGNGKWFTVLEREGLTDLMNERKIIQQTRDMYDQKVKVDMPSLSPLLYAPILLEGGVISYESNLITGGMGGYYFGIGSNVQFRRDTVTSMLRAVSVKNGSILNHVDARKTILSLELDSGLFKYVSYQHLLEIETGITTNEPPQMAVMETIEACVYSLIMQGLIDKIWRLKDNEKAAPLIDSFLNQLDS
jgi:curli production assembly/transport component CsgG